MAFHVIDRFSCDFIGNGEMTPDDLTREMGIAMKNTLRLTGYMEKDGIISCVPHETDRRATIVRITEKGWELLFLLWPGNYRFLNRAFEKLDAASRAALRELLEKVNLDFST